VARSLLKLMSYKDEYEVARLFSDGRFERALHEQFEGELTLAFHMAPPLLARGRDGQPPRKWRFGPWLQPLLKGWRTASGCAARCSTSSAAPRSAGSSAG
jgi:indolepyruvate ferredoxin oxidoreductase